MSDFLDRMRRLNEQAAQQDADARAAQVQSMAEHEAAERALAQKIIASIDKAADEAALAKKHNVRVMCLYSNKDYSGSVSTVATTQLTRADLYTKAGIVYDHIQHVMGVKPSFRFNYDDDGRNSWFELHITW